MRSLINFVCITLADFIVRAAYQMGKTPLLPIFASTLGATDAFLGSIVSVSTLTGMLLKPSIGILSDRWGRRWWLIIGTIFFVTMPFFYHFIHTPEQLFIIRLVHGLATAIYGPVTVAYVAEQKQNQRAQRLGWFGIARSGGYIVGPALAGGLLLVMEPIDVFTIIGLLSSLAFIPIFLLTESHHSLGTVKNVSMRRQIIESLKSGSRTPAVWLSGGLEFIVYIALYAVKAFLPIYSLSIGLNVALIGTFFALQEVSNVLFKPLGGRLGDQYGYIKIIVIGMVTIGCTLPLITLTSKPTSLLFLAVLIGAAQALIFPSTIALVSTQINEHYLGAGIGLVGTLKNSGKVVGPVLGGILVGWLNFTMMFNLIGILLIVGGLAVYRLRYLQRLSI
ncbi:MAG: MFS transporter [Symploca sp. SIO3C6]|uniref:MFS transporter n=1 Tax=Symploca sp. SIO1C4 TaxID=2607765 RepID=A0A6B3NC59_9CYAN|nr:MFS transporter [Symploca sp. SIO3C6]NER31136.1 MFS transporter [Symploca sp. SIO1C4]NET07520.1 MFS transporter [Symploca sp. SIO2B6]